MNRNLPILLLKRCFVNKNYELCSTYPNILVFPKVIASDKEFLFEAAKFRSKNRMPVLCWFDKSSNASIIRCSQPLVGLVGSRSTKDEELIQFVGDTNNSKHLFIFGLF